MAKYGTLIQRLRVPLGFVFAIAFLVFARPEPVTLIIGAIISIIGLLIRAWASGHIRKNKNLAVSGPYAYTRNPLYLGSFIMVFGFTIASGVWWLAVLFVMLFLAIYYPVMQAETKELTDIFGESYKEYSEKVPLFLPRLTAYKDMSSPPQNFDSGLYLKYREYRAALGLALAWGVLILKAIFLK